MKKLILLITILMFGFQLFSQNEKKIGDVIFSDSISFEQTYQYLKIDTNKSNIWQIGKPQKSIFNSAFNGENSIITNLVNTYPINNHSFFDIRIGEFNLGFEYPFNIFISFRHKFNTDTLKDGGYITVSYDNGLSWMNIIKDTIYQNFIGGAIPAWENMNLYSENNLLFNGENGFSGNSKEWNYTYFTWHYYPVKSIKAFSDTMIIRFNFISDNIETNKEGWMIDDIVLYSVDLGSKVEKIEKILFQLFPNPMSQTTKIELEKELKEITIDVYNIQGQLIDERKYTNSKSINLERKNLHSGIYFLKLKTENWCKTEKLVIE